MEYNSGETRIQILAVCMDDKRKEYFRNLAERSYFADILLCWTWEKLEELEKQTVFDLVVIVPTEDSPKVRAMIVDVMALAHRAEIPVLAVLVKGASGFEDFLYEQDITECVPHTISDGLLTTRIRRMTENYIVNRRMRALVKRKEKELEEQRESLHYRDDLTGCLNLAGFRRRAQELLKEHNDWQYALWYCDIKDFKYINERLGYEEGDNILRYWGQLALDYKREGEVIGCLTGDRFVGLIRITEDNETNPMEGVLEKVRHYFHDRGIEHDVRILTGIYSLTSEDYETGNIDHMIANAKIAQENLKESASMERWGFFNPEQFESDWRRMMISMHLPTALRDGEIEVYLQPQYDYETNCMRGAEALCRWKHAELGWISPGEFIPVLEKTGQIAELDMYMWEEVCKLLQKWKKAGIRMPISINISREDMLSWNLAEVFEGLMKKYEIDPDILHLEITESTYIDHAEIMIREVTNLVDAGFTVEMDDFGSGYSSLNMLKEVPVNVLKMDLRFLSNEGDSFRGENIIHYVVRMAHAMHMEVIAEGVETAIQADFLKSCGCSTMQGFFFSRPVPLERFERLLVEERERKRISDQKRKEKKERLKTREAYLELQQAKLEALRRIPGVIMFDYDMDTDCLDISVGLDGERISEKKVDRFFESGGGLRMLTHESAERLTEAFESLKEKGGTGSLDIMGSLMGLGPCWFRCLYTCLKDESGRVIHILGRMQSIESDMRLNEELRAKAEHDSMTDLLNHNASLEGIQIHLEHHEGGTVMMIDVDEFKYINDRNGHLYGDSILKWLAKELWKQFRRTDLIGRFGGDEFLVYMPGAFDEEFALRKAREINELCNSQKVKNIDLFSLSIGIAIVDENENITAEELIDRADTALYEVKRSGKNSARVFKKPD